MKSASICVLKSAFFTKDLIISVGKYFEGRDVPFQYYNGRPDGSQSTSSEDGRCLYVRYKETTSERHVNKD